MPKPPRSKLDRVVANAQRSADKGRVHPDTPDFFRQMGGRGQTAPSSRVKKVPKEGSRKFVGPRSPSSVESQTTDKWFGGPSRRGKNQKPKIRGAGSQAETRQPKFDPEWRRPSATNRVRAVGEMIGAKSEGGYMRGVSRAARLTEATKLSFKELVAAINKLPRAARLRLRDSLADGVRSGRAEFDFDNY